jgi:hypothetical protein
MADRSNVSMGDTFEIKYEAIPGNLSRLQTFSKETKDGESAQADFYFSSSLFKGTQNSGVVRQVRRSIQEQTTIPRDL